MKALQVSEARAMETLKKRIAEMKNRQQKVGDFLFMDEAQANLDDSDRKAVKKLKTQVEEEAATLKSLLADVKEAKRSPVFQKKAKQDVASRYKGPRAWVPPHENVLEQRNFKAFLPPASYIWVARSAGAWCSRVPPVKAQYRYWAREGSEDAAVRLVIMDAWATYLDLEGLPRDACPIIGLL